MTAYRLTFNISVPTAVTMADSLIEADYALGEAVSGLSSEGCDLLSHDFLTSRHGVTQFILRFTADDDAKAYSAAEAALRSVKAPTDSITLARRSRSYVPLGG